MCHKIKGMNALIGKKLLQVFRQLLNFKIYVLRNYKPSTEINKNLTFMICYGEYIINIPFYMSTVYSLWRFR